MKPTEGAAERFAALGLGALLLLVWPAGANARQSAASVQQPTTAAAPAPSQPADARFYLLSVPREDVRDAARTILGDALGLPFRVDDDVTGTVSFSVEATMTPAELLEQFEAALRIEGVAVRREGRHLVLIPVARETAAPEPAAAPTPAPAAEAVASSRPTPATAPPERGGLSWPLAAVLMAGSAALAALAAVLLSRRRRPKTRADPGGGWSASRQAVADALLAVGAVEPSALASAATVATRTHQPAERILLNMGAVTEEALATAYSAVTGCARWSPPALPPLKDTGPLTTTMEALRRHGMVLVQADGQRLTVAVADPLDDGPLVDVVARTGMAVSLLVGTVGEIEAALTAGLNDNRLDRLAIP